MSIRTQTLYAKFSVDNKEYTGRVINIDTLEHVSWVETVLYEANNETLDALDAELFTMEDDAWDKKFIATIRRYQTNGWNLSEKQAAQFQKIAQRHLKGKKIVVSTLDKVIEKLDGALEPNQIPF